MLPALENRHLEVVLGAADGGRHGRVALLVRGVLRVVGLRPVLRLLLDGQLDGRQLLPKVGRLLLELGFVRRRQVFLQLGEVCGVAVLDALGLCGEVIAGLGR